MGWTGYTFDAGGFRLVPGRRGRWRGGPAAPRVWDGGVLWIWRIVLEMLSSIRSWTRLRLTEPLEAAEFRALILELPQKMRLIGIVAATTGLRISEVLGLKWKDIDWKTLQMEVTRSVVDGVIGKCKTETSRRPVPIDELTAGELLAWKQETAYAEPEDWVFASDKVQGRMPPWADTLWIVFCNPPQSGLGLRNGWASTPSGTPTPRCSKPTVRMSKWFRS